ncbi:MAG: GAF domain-containing protein [Candidatus Omnitrophica bacterium]|nr:GAF domain-containing protein [Candidatus Omnitrophota bacterium]
MNPFALSGLLVVITCTMTAGLAYFTNRASRVNQLWAAFAMATSLWGLGALLVGLTADPRLALVWWRLAYVGIVFIPALFYHFVVVFTGLRRPQSVKASYAASTVFLLADASPLFITHVRKAFGQFYYKAPDSFLYLAFVVFFVGMALLSHLELWRALRRTKERRRRLLLAWFLAAILISFVGGATCFLPVFGVALYPYGNFAACLFPLLMAYAFLRYRLIDVNLALARALTFLATYALVFGVPLWVGARYQAAWQEVLGSWWWAAPVVLMGLLASASSMILLTVTRRLEQRLVHAQRRYHRTLVAASSGMTRIKDIQRLCRVITYMVNRTVRLTNASLFLYEPKEQRYALKAVRYPSSIPADMSVEQGHPLVEMLQGKKDLVVVEELQAALESPHAHAQGRQQMEAAYTWMRALEARLIVPSFSNDRLLAFLVLGGKCSGEAYATDDIAIFSGLANQAALAIENALFFEELRTNEAYMIQSEKLASLGQLASGMAHEIHNPLAIISGEAQLYLERFKGQDAKVDEVLLSIIEECKRAADITRRILRFAKPAPTDVTPVDLKATIEESLSLAAYQVRLERVERQLDVPDDLPKVRSNQNQLQEVLLNLILNACQAMGEKGGKLMLSARANGSHIVLKVADTGPGIPVSIQRKVFDPFYTTKPTGTGLGLFVSQRIVKSHGGTIELESTEGKGTCFTIHLPVWRQGEAALSSNGGS